MKSAAVKNQVRWRTSADESWSVPQDIPATGEHTIKGLDRTKTYEFQVRAVASCGAMSDWVSSTDTVPATTDIPDPGTVTTGGTIDGVKIDWDVTRGDLITEIERSTASAGPFAVACRTRGRSWTDPVLDTTTYYYRARNVDYAGTVSPWVMASAAAATLSTTDVAADTLANAQAIIDEAQTRAAETAANAQAITDEASARVADVNQEASDRAAALLTQYLDLDGQISTEETLRQSADASLALRVDQVAAGSGEQFDAAPFGTGSAIWNSDADLGTWYGSNGGPTVSNGYLRPGNGTGPWAGSPLIQGIVGSDYNYVKAKIKKTGSPTWRGILYWILDSDPSYNAAKSQSIPEPIFDGDGDATIDFKDIPWADDLRRIRFDVSSDQTATDYFEIDWIAIGRPTPGASTAALETEKQARITADSAEATSRETLAAQLRGSYTGTNPASLTTGLVYEERQARVTAENAQASTNSSLQAAIDDAEADIALRATITDLQQVETDLNSAEGTITSHTTQINQAQSDIAGKAEQTALNATNTNVSQNANAITAVGNRTSTLEGSVNDPQTGLGARALNTEFQTTKTQVNTNAGDISAQSTQLNQVQAGLTGGGNLLGNSEFSDIQSNGDIEGYIVFGDQSPTFKAYNSAPWIPEGICGAALKGNAGNALANGESMGAIIGLGYSASDYWLPVEVGKKYCASAYCGNHRCHAEVFWQWYKADGTFIANSAREPTGLDAGALGGPALSDFGRLYNVDTAPTDAAYARMYLRGNGTGAAGTDSYVFVVQPMFEEIPAAQTGPSPYSPSAAGQGSRLSANASATQLLDSRIDTNDGDIAANSYAITQVQAALPGKADVSVTQLLDSRVTTNDGDIATMQASYALELDVNGYVSGMYALNNGAISSLVFQQDVFTVRSSGGHNATSLEWRAGILTARKLNAMTYLGSDIGPDNLVFAHTPSPHNPTDVTMANSTVAMAEDGRVKFGGTWGNLTAGWSSGGDVTYVFAGGNPATLDFDVSAGTMKSSGHSISYNAGSAQVTQTRNTSEQYYLYYDDPAMEGGTKTLHVSTNPDVTYSNPGYVLVKGPVVVFIPSSGGGSGSGPNNCVVVDACVPTHDRAGDVLPGDLLVVGSGALELLRKGRVSASYVAMAQCVRITADNGMTLDCSDTAPIATVDDGCIIAPALVGYRVPVVIDGEFTTTTITSVESIGERAVQAITCENDTFLAGNERGRYFLHHNIKTFEP